MDKLLSFEGRYLDELDAQELLLIAKDTMRENEQLKHDLDRYIAIATTEVNPDKDSENVG